MQQYDIASKVLIDRCRDDIIRYLLDIPVQESRILEPLPQETVSLKRGDYPIMITDESGGQEMAIIEIYAEWDNSIPLHLIDYRVRHKIQHGVEARSCVILLRPSKSATNRYEDRELRFRFQLVKIYEMDARRVVSEGPLCMLPFVPLMKGGEAALDEAEDLVYRSEKTRPVKADMLTSMAILSGLVSAELPARLIARRKDIMIESAAYEIIKKEGYAEGVREGVLKGRSEANRENARNLILLGILKDEQIAQATGLNLEEILKLKKEMEK
jgi:hypothetical protein